MLTLSKIRTYERFRGDIDGFARTHGVGDTSGITDHDWAQIDRLCQALHIIAHQKAADSFRVQTEQELQAITDDETTREALRDLAMT